MGFRSKKILEMHSCDMKELLEWFKQQQMDDNLATRGNRPKVDITMQSSQYSYIPSVFDVQTKIPCTDPQWIKQYYKRPEEATQLDQLEKIAPTTSETQYHTSVPQTPAMNVLTSRSGNIPLLTTHDPKSPLSTEHGFKCDVAGCKVFVHLRVWNDLRHTSQSTMESTNVQDLTAMGANSIPNKNSNSIWLLQDIVVFRAMTHIFTHGRHMTIIWKSVTLSTMFLSKMRS
jgi:hypothetical protein